MAGKQHSDDLPCRDDGRGRLKSLVLRVNPIRGATREIEANPKDDLCNSAGTGAENTSPPGLFTALVPVSRILMQNGFAKLLTEAKNRVRLKQYSPENGSGNGGGSAARNGYQVGRYGFLRDRARITSGPSVQTATRRMDAAAVLAVEAEQSVRPWPVRRPRAAACRS